jgi:cell division protein ZapA (FtsZ GTPase activity inhibitor)
MKFEIDFGGSVHVHVHVHGEGGANEELLRLVQKLLDQESEMSQAFDRIRQSVANAKGRDASGATLIRQFGDYVRRHADDPAALNQLADDLDNGGTDLLSAISENPLPTEDTGEPAPTTTETDGGTVDPGTGLRR